MHTQLIDSLIRHITKKNSFNRIRFYIGMGKNLWLLKKMFFKNRKVLKELVSMMMIVDSIKVKERSKKRTRFYRIWIMHTYTRLHGRSCNMIYSLFGLMWERMLFIITPALIFIFCELFQFLYAASSILFSFFVFSRSIARAVTLVGLLIALDRIRFVSRIECIPTTRWNENVI